MQGKKINVREKHQLADSHKHPTTVLSRNPGMCPDWESNQRPFGSPASAQATEPQQPGQVENFYLQLL